MKEPIQEEIIAYIQFYNEIKKVILPPTYKGLQEKLCSMLQINLESISSLQISYKDEDNDVVMVDTNEDYLILLDQIKNKQVNIINIEKKEKGNIDIDTCHKSLIKFNEKLDKKDEANNNFNIVSNQQFEINKQENKIGNNKININNNNIENKLNNNLDENSNELEIKIINKEIYNNIDNNLNDSNSEEEIISPYIQKEKEQKIEANYNININNQVNDINNINNIKNDNFNDNANVNLNQTYLVFNLNCDLCNKFPIIKVLYYCPTCSIYICPECEKKPDINHRHSILKIQTKQQFDDLNEKINKSSEELSLEKNNNNSQINLTKIKDNIKDSVLKIFGGNKEENNIPKQNLAQQMSLMQIARAQYGLEGISDQQLENAIKKTNGDIEKAIPLLFK